MRNQLLAQILQEVLRINAHTQYAAFYSYSGHVEKIQVYISMSKEDFSNWIWDLDVLMGIDFGDPTQKLRACLDHLKTYV